MAPMVESVEIARRPEDVFSYVTDPAHLTEWQESLVSASLEGDGPVALGSRLVTVRHVGGRDRPMTMEITELSPPNSWRARGVDGPVRGIVHGTVEPLGDGARSRVTIRLDFEGHGMGMLLVPLVVRRQAKAELPTTTLKLKEVLESGTA
jgi:uncharacterized protein YndB with AHSA1/START domain